MSSKDEKKILPFYQDTGYGFNVNGLFSLDALKSALAYKPRPDDLFIVTYPKCGTTWVQNIVACIFKEGKPFSSALEFLTNTPFLEMAGAEAAKKMQRPGAVKLHLPFYFTPWSPEAKYIFVARNPKDCVVSFYHHTKNIKGYEFQNGTFDDFFELFMDGKVDFGDYFDTLISWYQHKDDPNILFITYEDLKKDARGNILKIAEFMGQKYKDMLIRDESILDNVMKYSSYDFMKNTLNRQVAELAALPKEFVQNHPDIPPGLKKLIEDNFFDSDPNSITFVRSGIVGDYKNYLSPEQNRRLEQKFKVKTRGTDIADLWKDIIKLDTLEPEMTLFKPSSKPPSQFIAGLQVFPMLSTQAVISGLGYKPRSDDVFIATYPKCGTTWAQQILLLIFKQGELPTSPKEFFAASPYLEFMGAEAVEKMARPNSIKSHLPYHLIPRSDNAKYIYVTRNPKDCCVSYFHHMKDIPFHFFNGSFNEYFELFISGNVDQGDYFDHLLGWYAHRNDPNILFLTYEEMKEHPEEAVLKMASFIDDKKYAEPLRNDPTKLQNILKHSSFNHMKENYSKNLEYMFQMPLEEILNSDVPDAFKALLADENVRGNLEMFEAQSIRQFFRKGITGDWRNYFSEEQNKRLDEKFAERTNGTDIPNMFKKYM